MFATRVDLGYLQCTTSYVITSLSPQLIQMWSVSTTFVHCDTRMYKVENPVETEVAVSASNRNKAIISAGTYIHFLQARRLSLLHIPCMKFLLTSGKHKPDATACTYSNSIGTKKQ